MKVLNLLLILFWRSAQSTSTPTKYKKPEPSNEYCIITIEAIQSNQSIRCLGCPSAKEECDEGCQPLLEALQKHCKGVNLPRFYFYDPFNSLGGNFDDEVTQRMLKSSAAKCGCEW